MSREGAIPEQADRARLTPYELVFTEGDFESRIFPRIRREAEEQAVAASTPERFDFLSTAAEVIRELVEEDAPAEALEQYRALLFHAYHFWAAGRQLYTVDPAVARYLVESSPRVEGGELVPPAPSCYLQLPANLFWSSIAPEDPPEPVDGFFLTLGEHPGPQGETIRELHLLVILGIRRSRAGFSIIPLRLPLDEDLSELWEQPMRAGGEFSSSLPGGELAGLYSLLTTGEVFKLVTWICAYIDQLPGSLEQVPGSEAEATGEVAPGSRLDSLRLVLRAEGESERAGS